MSTGTVAVVAFAGISPFHLSVPGLVFGVDRRSGGIPRYDVRVCCAEGRRSVPTSGGYAVTAEHGLEGLRGAGTVIIPTWRSPEDAARPAMLRELRAAHKDGARIVGLCLGAFVVAEAGFLDGRSATTHWRYAADLAERYPAIRVDPERLWIDVDDVVTSAGTVAAIDCCLHLVRREHGADVANRLARRLVIAPHRSGDQSQYVERPVSPSDAPDAIGTTVTWARQHLGRPIAVDDLATRAQLSRSDTVVIGLGAADAPPTMRRARVLTGSSRASPSARACAVSGLRRLRDASRPLPRPRGPSRWDPAFAITQFAPSRAVSDT